MYIVDSHAHLGTCRVFDLEVTAESLLETMDRNGVDAAIVQPFPGCPDPEKMHDQIAALANKHPGRIYGLASINPHFGERAWTELTRCVKELGFVATKLHTIGHAMLPTSKDAMKLAELTQELGVPLMAHTGTGAPFALPSLCLPLARSFPELKIVLAHAGYAIYTAEAMMVAREAKNIYLELSWCTSVQSKGIMGSLGAERVMMGSDLPLNLATELAKARNIGLTQTELELYLGLTAKGLFKLV